jgi:hypothetical protein
VFSLILITSSKGHDKTQPSSYHFPFVLPPLLSVQFPNIEFCDECIIRD